ncbi:MAG: S4 domain-containing protein, partial [Gemmatimonadota bacterium]
EQKMSKSYNNYIGITEAAEQQFGKTMSIPDTLLEEWYALAGLGARRSGDPYQDKRALGRIIARTYHGDEAAARAEAHFDRLFKQHALPDEIPEATVRLSDPGLKHTARSGTVSLVGVLVATGLAGSRSEAARLIGQGAIAVNEERISEKEAMLPAQLPFVLRRGKRQFVKVRFE